MNKMALSHPQIRFQLSHDGRVVFQTSGNGNIQEILYQMYGKEVAQNAIQFEGNNEDFQYNLQTIQIFLIFFNHRLLTTPSPSKIFYVFNFKYKIDSQCRNPKSNSRCI